MKKIVAIAVGALLATGLFGGVASAHDAELVTDPNLTVHLNNGAYHHDYNVAYTCGADDVVLLSGTGKAADNAGETILEGSYIDWTNNTFSLTARYDRADNYTYTISGALGDDGSFSFTQASSSGVTQATGAFIGAPTCEAVPPSTANDCKDGGWEAITSDPGPFKNQGQCVSHFARNK